MSKKTISFSHNCNAHNNRKLIALQIEHGMQGYGVYFAILEILGEHGGFLPYPQYASVLGYFLRVDEKLVKSVIEDFKLFQYDGPDGYFYSENLIYRMLIQEDISEKRRQAGKKGAEKRWQNGKTMTKFSRGE